MLFSSLTFIFLFLPAVLLLFYSLRTSLRFPLLLISSLFFYFFGENYLLWIMLATTLIDYSCGLLIAGGMNRKKIMPLERGVPRSRSQKFWLALSVVSNLSLLGYFKYFNFFTDNVAGMLEMMNLGHASLDNLVRIGLPLGISFYTFQSMSYTIDVYRGQVTANRNLVSFATFVTMFPQLVAGPIVRYSDIEKQLSHHALSGSQFARGVRRFLEGLAKKVLIANTMGEVADNIFGISQGNLSTGIAWIGVVAYTLQIYFDFSGYSCMAIGLGRMFGFEFPENFNYPYVSRSVSEFWRRWHMTLSTWFRDYLFLPIAYATSRKLEKERYFGLRADNVIYLVAIMITFFLCGLWHGASWNFVAWGIYFGIFLVIERLWLGKRLKKLPKIIAHFYLVLVVMVAWVLFRHDTLPGALSYLQVMFTWKQSGTYSPVEFLDGGTILAFLCGFVLSMPVVPGLIRLKKSMKPTLAAISEFSYMFCLFLLFFFCIVNLTTGTYNPFIYFRF